MARRKARRAAPALEPPDWRGFIALVAVAALAGPLNFLLGSLLYAVALTQAPGGPGEAPLAILSQLIAALVTIGLCVLVVARLTRLARGWGYALGIAIAFLTNPLVLVNLLGSLAGGG
ncbi:MAG: hypothetical protein U0556_04950 [Dehalococcoidia bacterium]